MRNIAGHKEPITATTHVQALQMWLWQSRSRCLQIAPRQHRNARSKAPRSASLQNRRCTNPIIQMCANCSILLVSVGPRWPGKHFKLSVAITGIKLTYRRSTRQTVRIHPLAPLKLTLSVQTDPAMQSRLKTRSLKLLAHPQPELSIFVPIQPAQSALLPLD